MPVCRAVVVVFLFFLSLSLLSNSPPNQAALCRNFHLPVVIVHQMPLPSLLAWLLLPVILHSRHPWHFWGPMKAQPKCIVFYCQDLPRVLLKAEGRRDHNLQIWKCGYEKNKLWGAEPHTKCHEPSRDHTCSGFDAVSPGLKPSIETIFIIDQNWLRMNRKRGEEHSLCFSSSLTRVPMVPN